MADATAAETRPRVLVARIGAIGDICLLLPVVHALARHCDVDWLIRDEHVALVRAFPQVACRLIGVSPGPDPRQPFPPALVATLRAARYQALIDCSHWASVAWLAAALDDVPVRAVTRDPKQDALLGVERGLGESAFTCVVPVAPHAHQVEKWIALVRAACGIELQLDWPLSPPRAIRADRPLRLFIHPHASKPEKVWPARHFARVLTELARRRRVHCLVNGVRRRITHELRGRLLLARATTEVVPIDPSYARLRAALGDVDLALGCDSGPLHFAALLGVPTLVLYARYPAAEFGPLWRSTAVSPPPGRDVDAIEPSQVSAALHAWLDGAT
ncbi:MAG: glycosyltransferase family 9 protein [Deltaproteobacteria bacterium]|nr:glycosyltransferase family 9 protein [Deltaproteobacteria bacterium]